MPTLRELRRASRVTLREAAQAIGMGPTTVLRYESGEREPTVATIKKLATLYVERAAERAHQAEAIAARKGLLG